MFLRTISASLAVANSLSRSTVLTSGVCKVPSTLEGLEFCLNVLKSRAVVYDRVNIRLELRNADIGQTYQFETIVTAKVIVT